MRLLHSRAARQRPEQADEMTDRDTFDKVYPDALKSNAMMVAMLAYLASAS